LYLSIRYALPGVFASNPYPIAVNGSLWTLPVEAFMYVVTLLLGLSGSLNRRACLGVVLIFVLLHFGVPATSVTKNGVVLHQMPYAQLTGLGILYFSGAFYAVLRFEWKENKNMVLVCAFALVTLARSPLAELVSYIALPYLILSLAHFRSRFSRGVSKAGDFSYGIYLYAFPVQQTVALLLGDKVSPLQIGLLSLPITLLLAGASWYLVEKPMLELKRFLGRRRGAILQES